jgi:hypothetical protein
MGIDSHLSTCVGTQSPKYLEMAQGHISLSELGHGKQRRLKALYKRDIPELDTVSKSAQSAPGGYF